MKFTVLEHGQHKPEHVEIAALTSHQIMQPKTMMSTFEQGRLRSKF